MKVFINMKKNNFILGAGITGLVGGFAAEIPIFEANGFPGGICSSYYIKNADNKVYTAPPDEECYRFEFGGGHWIFGSDTAVDSFSNAITFFKEYKRVSSVYFPDTNAYVPYPIQNNLRFLESSIADKAVSEMSQQQGNCTTMKEWQQKVFGSTLCRLFFYPFHELYTAGFYDCIAPQDAYKSPVDLSAVKQGASEETAPIGYNTSFLYPGKGLDEFARGLSLKCNVNYNKRVIKIDPFKKEIIFNDSDRVTYDKLISTLPLNKMIEMTGLKINTTPDPYTSVLVLNIGAVRGDQCPDDHWLYIPHSESGFHRVGFYSNVDESFLPESCRGKNDRVSLYIERAFPGSLKPAPGKIKSYTGNVIKELKKWNFIKDVEVLDSSWVDVAYTWAWPNSEWKQTAIDMLKTHDIYQIGRYGKWHFQGIADSIRDGLSVPDLLNR